MSLANAAVETVNSINITATSEVMFLMSSSVSGASIKAQIGSRALPDGYSRHGPGP